MNYKLRIINSLIISLCFAIPIFLCHDAFAGGDPSDGHTHVNEKPVAAKTFGDNYFTVNSVSNKFELVLRYEPILPNEQTVLKLFVSDYITNIPLKGANIKITALEDENLKFTVKYIEPGIYEIIGKFPKKQRYTLAANISTSIKSDLLLLKYVEVGKVFPPASDEHSHPFFTWQVFLFALIGILLGAALAYYYRRRRRREETDYLNYKI